MLTNLGFSPGGLNGSIYWTLPSGRTLWDEANLLLEQDSPDIGSDAPIATLLQVEVDGQPASAEQES